MVRTETITAIPGSPFAIADTPSPETLRTEGPLRYVVVRGRQDDGLWGPVGALWLSRDRTRGGFLVHPWALWAGSEIARGYRSAMDRGWSPEQVFAYWRTEVWPGGHVPDEAREASSLRLLADLLDAL